MTRSYVPAMSSLEPAKLSEAVKRVRYAISSLQPFPWKISSGSPRGFRAQRLPTFREKASRGRDRRKREQSTSLQVRLFTGTRNTLISRLKPTS